MDAVIEVTIRLVTVRAKNAKLEEIVEKREADMEKMIRARKNKMPPLPTRIIKRKTPHRVFKDGSLAIKHPDDLESSSESVPPQLRSYPVSIMEPLRRLKDGRK